MAVVAKNGNGNGPAPVTLAVMSLILSIGFGFYTVANPKGDTLLVKSEAREDLRLAEDRLNREIVSLKMLTLSKDEHREFVARTDQGLEIQRQEIGRMRADQVTRSEHQQHWNETTERINTVRDLANEIRHANDAAMADLRKDIGGQYTLGDQLKNLQDQIKGLATRLDAMRRMPTPP